MSGNASSATKVNNKLILRFDTGATENTTLYTYDGSAAKTIDIKAGSNVSITKAENTVTINSTNTNTYVTQNTTTTTAYRPFLLGYDTTTILGNFENITSSSFYANTLRVQPSTGNIISSGTITANGVDSSGVHSFSGSDGQWSSPGVILAFTKSLNNWTRTTYNFDQLWKIGSIRFSASRSGRNITVYHYLGHTNYMAMGNINAGSAVITHVSSNNVSCDLTIEGSYAESHKINIVIFGNNA